MPSTIDNKTFSKMLAEWSDKEKYKEEHDMLQAIAANPVSPEGQKALANITYSLQEPIRKGLMDEDTIGDIYITVPVNPGEIIDFPIHFYQATDRDKFWAYAIPTHGYLPQRYVSTDSVQVRSYQIANSIDCYIRHIKMARWDIISDILEVFRNGFVKKINSDGWTTLAAAMFYRNIVVNDNTAAPNQITPRLLSLMQVFMRRNGGGNMNSRGYALTDLYVSPEAAASMRSWDLSLVPESVRTSMFSAGAGMPIANLFGITINEHEDLGIGQPLQQLLTLPADENGFGLPLPPGTRELVMGMDRRNTKNYAKMPVVNPGIEIFADNSSYTHRAQTIGWYGWMNLGMAILDNSFCCLGAF